LVRRALETTCSNDGIGAKINQAASSTA